MGIFRRSSTTKSDERIVKYADFPSSFFVKGYTKLIDNPEFRAGIDKIADLISNMTIMVMENTNGGSRRIKNDISRTLDIEPNNHMTRKTFIYNLVNNLLITGNQITIPKYNKGKLINLIPIIDSDVSFYGDKYSYEIKIDGKIKQPDEVLHFKINPRLDSPYVGSGYQVQLRDVLNNLKQATATKKAFMSNKYMPPVIVAVDSNSEKIKSKEGREEILKNYIETDEGKPWIIPSTSMDVKQVKPLTLQDIAINESVEIDKKTVAVVLGIPAFLLGVGDYDKEEYNNFIATKIMSIVEVIQQEFTKGLIYEDNQYVKFNIRSLYRYSLTELTVMARNMRASGVIDGNEARDLIGYDPRDGLDELVMLENYIPNSKAGDQKKLK